MADRTDAHPEDAATGPCDSRQVGRRSRSAGARFESRRLGSAATRAATRSSAPRAGEVVNDLLPFLEFVEHHPVGTSVNGTVESYSSHGAYVSIGRAACAATSRCG